MFESLDEPPSRRRPAWRAPEFQGGPGTAWKYLGYHSAGTPRQIPHERWRAAGFARLRPLSIPRTYLHLLAGAALLSEEAFLIMSTVDHSRRSIPEIFTDMVNQLTSLFGTEIALARAEMSEKISQAVGGLALIIIGAVLLIPAIVVLLEAAVNALEDAGIDATFAALIVGGAALLIGLVLLGFGMSRLRTEALAPTRTIEQLRRDAALASNQAS